MLDDALVVVLRERRRVEQHDGLVIHHRPMLRRNEREEIAHGRVEPLPPTVGREVKVLAPRVVPQRARVVEETDARRLLPGAEQFLARLHQRRQSLVTPVQKRFRALFRRRTPEDRQHHVDARGHHVLQLPAMPRDRFPTQPLERGRMGGERVGAVAVHDVGLRRRVVPIEVVGADDAVGAAKRFRLAKSAGLRFTCGPKAGGISRAAGAAKPLSRQRERKQGDG